MPPYIGLVISSVGFIIPCIVAWHRRKRFDAVASGALTITSIAYHGTLHPMFQKVDMCVAHAIGLISIPRSFHRMLCWKRKWVEGFVFVGTLSAIAVYWIKSKNNPYDDSKLWHLGFHVLCQSTWLTHVSFPTTTTEIPQE
jgi:hypothetical protein